MADGEEDAFPNPKRLDRKLKSSTWSSGIMAAGQALEEGEEDDDEGLGDGDVGRGLVFNGSHSLGS